MPALERAEPRAASPFGPPEARPVVLATLDVPFDADAVAYAFDSALELGQRLVVANFVERAHRSRISRLRYQHAVRAIRSSVTALIWLAG